MKIPSVCSRVRGAGSYEGAGSPQAGVAESVVSARERQVSHWMNVDGFVVGGQVAPGDVLWPGSGALLVEESGVVGLVSRPGLVTI